MMKELFGEFLGTLILILLGMVLLQVWFFLKPRATMQVGL